MSNQFFGRVPQESIRFPLPRIFFDAENARQHANDIAVKYRRGLVERDAANGAGGVAADAGQSQDRVKCFGKPAAVPFKNEYRRLLHVPNARVIAQPFPKFVDFCRACLRQRLNRWQLPHPTLPIRQHGLDLGLLKHDFRNPDGVRIARPAPGQVAGVGREPGEQRRDEIPKFWELSFGS